MFYWVQIQICKIKAEYAESSRDVKVKDLVSFSSANKGFELIDDDEILANGKMYDIVKTCANNGVIVYYALPDGDEDQYVRELIAAEKNDSAQKSTPGKNISLYSAKYFAAKNHLHPLCFSVNLLISASPLKNSAPYNSPYKDIYSPPPKYFSS